MCGGIANARGGGAADTWADGKMEGDRMELSMEVEIAQHVDDDLDGADGRGVGCKVARK